MKAHSTNELFDLVRQAPAELSKEQVVSIIKVLPTTAPGHTWFKKFNLNSIIMTTTAITIAGSALIYLLNLGSDPQPPVEPVLDTEPSQTEVVQPESPKTETVESQPAPMQAEDVSINQSTPSTEEANVMPAPKVDEDPTPASPVVIEVSPAAVELSSVAAIKVPVNSATPPFEALNSEELVVEEHQGTTISKGDQLQLRRLKREFLRNIKKDRLTNRKKQLNVLTYSSNGISVNQAKLGGPLLDKYLALMEKYGIRPADDKKVVTHPDYIMVGRFTDQGFRGQALGREMDVQFYDDGISWGGLFGGNAEPQDPTTTSRQEAEPLFNNEESNTNNLNLNPADTETTEPILLERPMDLNAEQIKIKGLKKELYRNLVGDDLIASDKTHVRMPVPQGNISVNGELLKQNYQEKYSNILEKYNIPRTASVKILMSPEFILAGRFSAERFDGAVQGSVKAEKVRGSILEDDLRGLSFIDDGNHIDTDDGIKLNSKINKDPKQPIETREEREIDPFHSIRVEGVAVVYLTKGPHRKAKLKVTGMPINDVKTRVENGMLEIDTRGNPQGERIAIYVSSPNLKSIIVGGAGELYSENTFEFEDLHILVEGAGAAWVDVDVKNLKIEMNGGDLDIAGKAEYGAIRLLPRSESGSLRQTRLKIENYN